MKWVLTLTALLTAAASGAQGGGVNLSDWYVLGETGGQIYRYDLQTGQSRVIVPATSGYYPSPQDYFAPSGLVIYVLENQSGYRHLWLTDIEGSFRRQLTTLGENDAARFSPDGSKFIFVHSDTSIYSPKSVDLYDLASEQITQLIPASENVTYGADFLPDGNGFIYGTGWGTNAETLRWKRANGTDSTIGTAHSLGLMRISPDQSEVAFHSDDFGAYRVERMNLGTGVLSTGPAYGLAGISYFPDGSYAYNYGSVQRFAPWTGQSTLLVGADLNRPVVGPKSRTVCFPISYTVASGYDATGELADLYASDDHRLCFFADDLTLVAEVNINGRSWKQAPNSLTFTLESQVARAGLSQTLRLRNYAQGTYVVADGRVASGTDVTVSVSFTSTAQEYVGPGGAMRARITWAPINDEAPSQDGWLHCIDTAKWTIE